MCSKQDICPGGSIFSSVPHYVENIDAWTPYRDSINGWMHITTISHDECRDHGDYGPPRWGTTGSMFGKALCCQGRHTHNYIHVSMKVKMLLINVVYTELIVYHRIHIG